MPYRVVVIGAGFAGIGMAIALQQAGIEDFVVLDLADGTRPWPGRTSTWLPTGSSGSSRRAWSPPTAPPAPPT